MKKLKLFAAIILSALIFLTASAGLIACVSEPETYTLTVFYTSDSHGFLAPAEDNDVIGIDRIAAAKKQTPDSLLLDAGDFSHGQPLATLTKGQDVVTLMKEAGYDATAAGNHEFDYGMDIFFRNAGYAASGDNPMPVMSANIYNALNKRALTPYIIKTVNGVKIGIFALTTLEAFSQAVPKTFEGYEFKNPVSEAEKAVSELKDNGCAVIIALTHIGSEYVVAPFSDEIAKVDGIDIVIDGHSHVEIEGRQIENGALLVSPGEYGQKLGKLEIEYTAGGVVSADNTLLGKEDLSATTPEESVLQALSDIEDGQKALLAKVLANIPFGLEATKTIVRTQETNLGNLMTDAMIASSGADFAIANGGGIRASIAAGNITAGDCITTFPYFNLVVAKRITGNQLKEILEHAYAGLPEAEGRFAQIGGFKVALDLSKPEGERVVSLTKSDGTQIGGSTVYTLAINEYIGAGGDGYPVLGGLPVIYQGATEDQVFIEFIKNSTDLSDYAIAAGRITFIS